MIRALFSKHCHGYFPAGTLRVCEARMKMRGQSTMYKKKRKKVIAIVRDGYFATHNVIFCTDKETQTEREREGEDGVYR